MLHRESKDEHIPQKKKLIPFSKTETTDMILFYSNFPVHSECLDFGP